MVVHHRTALMPYEIQVRREVYSVIRSRDPRSYRSRQPQTKDAHSGQSSWLIVAEIVIWMLNLSDSPMFISLAAQTCLQLSLIPMVAYA